MGSDADPPPPPPPTDSVGGWYSSDAVERRLRKVRSRPPSGAGRTAPQPSEEDHWLKAGAYDGLLLEAAARAPPHAAAAVGAEGGSAQPPSANADPAAAAAAAAAWAPLPHTRLSSGSVLLGNVASFLRTYELLLLPMYATCDGFRGAQLLLRDLPPGASRGGLLAAATGAGRGAAVVTMLSITTWASPHALEAAQQRVEYAAAMRQLQPLFHEPPTPSSWGLVAAAPPLAAPATAGAAPQ